jgi:uncharacterized damage-inducible protein DinB
MKISDALLPELDQEMPKLRTVLERCPEDKYGWKPHAKSFTMAELATHLASIPEWGAETLTKDSFDVAPPGAPPYKPEIAANRKDLLARFDKGTAALREAVAATSDADMMKPWSLLSGGKALFTLPRVVILRSMILNHAIHHRAQLTVYLRLNDVPVPAIYGPSADEQPSL